VNRKFLLTITFLLATILAVSCYTVGYYTPHPTVFVTLDPTIAPNLMPDLNFTDWWAVARGNHSDEFAQFTHYTQLLENIGFTLINQNITIGESYSDGDLKTNFGKTGVSNQFTSYLEFVTEYHNNHDTPLIAYYDYNYTTGQYYFLTYIHFFSHDTFAYINPPIY